MRDNEIRGSDMICDGLKIVTGLPI